jgi:hypothetical protein
MNIMAKHDGQATAASFDSQYRHCGESDETAAPQFGQLRVCASMGVSSTRIVRAVRGHPCPQENVPPEGKDLLWNSLDEFASLCDAHASNLLCKATSFRLGKCLYALRLCRLMCGRPSAFRQI